MEFQFWKRWGPDSLFKPKTASLSTPQKGRLDSSGNSATYSWVVGKYKYVLWFFRSITIFLLQKIINIAKIRNIYLKSTKPTSVIHIHTTNR